MTKYLLSATDGSVVGLYTKGDAVCIGGRTRHKEAFAGLKHVVDTIAAETVPSRTAEWSERRVQRNKSVWSTRLPDAVLAEDVLRETIRTARGWEGVLAKEVKKLGNAIY